MWTGKWPAGTYNVTLKGSGMAELYLQQGFTTREDKQKLMAGLERLILTATVIP